MHAGGDAVPGGALFVGGVGVGQPLRVGEGAHNLQIGDLGTLVSLNAA